MTQNTKHGCRVGVEQGHSVGELVPDHEVLFSAFLSRQGCSGQRSSVITKIILNGGCLHFVLVKFQDEFQNFRQLFHQSLLSLEMLGRGEITGAQLA